MRKLCDHRCWKKVSLAVASNRVETCVNRSRFSTCYRDKYKQRVLRCTDRKNYKREEFLSLHFIISI
jgi:hypothetical protein